LRQNAQFWTHSSFHFLFPSESSVYGVEQSTAAAFGAAGVLEVACFVGFGAGAIASTDGGGAAAAAVSGGAAGTAATDGAGVADGGGVGTLAGADGAPA
jgi:hypothetical protein